MRGGSRWSLIFSRLHVAWPGVTWRQGNLIAGKLPWFGRTVIKSCAKLDYGTAQKMIEGDITVKDAAAGAVGTCVALALAVAWARRWWWW